MQETPGTHAPLQVRLAWRVEVRHAESALRLSFDGKQTTLLKRVVLCPKRMCLCIYLHRARAICRQFRLRERHPC